MASSTEASSMNSQQSDATKPDAFPPSPDLSQDSRPPRVVLLDINDDQHGGLVYMNRRYLEENEPSRETTTQNGSVYIDLSHDIFYLSHGLIGYRFSVMDDLVLEYPTYKPGDGWNTEPETRPHHIMVNARSMLVVLQEAISGNSVFHEKRALVIKTPREDVTFVLGRGVPDFFQILGISTVAGANDLQKVMVLVPSRPDDILGEFQYNDLELVPFVASDPSSRDNVTRLAKTQTQVAQLSEIMDMWSVLLHQVSAEDFNAQLPPIEFARRSQT